MQKIISTHSEESNELFNLMARQIKKRCEERVNMFIVENKPAEASAEPIAADHIYVEDNVRE